MSKKKQVKEKRVPKVKVKKGDEVLVVTGKDAGRRGKVNSVDAKERTCIVEGINEYKKHQKPSQKKPQGGIITIAMPIHVSNVMVIDKSSGKATRVGRRKVGNKSLRFAKISGELIDSE
jgi:large subunit ribosomal protein L24